MQKNTLEGKAKTKNGIKRLCFCAVCILLEVIFIVSMITRLNEYAEIVNLLTRLLGTILVLALYASDQTSSMKMPWIILILIFPIMGVALYLLIGLNGGTRKMRKRYEKIDSRLFPLKITFATPQSRKYLHVYTEKFKLSGVPEYRYHIL